MIPTEAQANRKRRPEVQACHTLCHTPHYARRCFLETGLWVGFGLADRKGKTGRDRLIMQPLPWGSLLFGFDFG